MDKWASYLRDDKLLPFSTGVLVGCGTLLVCYNLFRRLSATPVVAQQISSFDKLAKLTKLRAENLAKGVSRNHKMVFVVRTDLGMGKGKIAAQCSHAAIKCYQRAQEIDKANLDMWEATGVTKVCLKFDGDEVELKKLEKKAKELGIVTGLICDAGHTQIARGSFTVLGLGPAPINLIDEVTGHLKLL